MSKFVPNPRFADQFKKTRGFKAMLGVRGLALGAAAESIGKQVSSSYNTKVVPSAEGVQVVAETDPLSASGWIEFGTADLPAHAPLRKGAEAVGMKTRRVR